MCVNRRNEKSDQCQNVRTVYHDPQHSVNKQKVCHKVSETTMQSPVSDISLVALVKI